MRRRRRKYFHRYFFSDGRQLFGLKWVKEIPGNNEKVIVRGVESAPFYDIFNIDRTQRPVLKEQIIERSKEPLIEKYIEACYTHNKELYEEIMQKLREKYIKYE